MQNIQPVKPVTFLSLTDPKSRQRVDNDFIKFAKKDIEQSKIKGVGQDAEVVKNSKGGLQSKSIGYFHYIDPPFIIDSFQHNASKKVMRALASFMMGDIDEDRFIKALRVMYPDLLERIAKVMEYGATKSNNGKGYPFNNWRLIPQEEHINHAIIHLYALDRGDTQDNHLDHALTRIMMAVGTDPSPEFSKGYTKT